MSTNIESANTPIIESSKVPDPKHRWNFDNVRTYVYFTLACLGIILSIFFIIVFLIIFSQFANSNANNDKFIPSSADELGDVEYFGKEDLFIEMMSDMTKIIVLTDIHKPEELADLIKTTSRNYLFSGAAGTGKTQFVKKLVFRLDRNLANYYKNKKKTYVRAIFVTPSMLEDKYVGETEKNIQKLFKTARENKGYKATIIFLDEVDSFFGKRRMTDQEYTLKCKSEFLNLMSGINEDLASNTFIIGATNRPDDIDHAFLRRMGQHIKFDNPNKEEMVSILQFFLAKWPKENDYKELLNECADILVSKNCSQANITELCTKIKFRYLGKDVDMVRKLYNAIKSVENLDQISFTDIDMGKSEALKEWIFE